MTLQARSDWKTRGELCLATWLKPYFKCRKQALPAFEAVAPRSLRLHDATRNDSTIPKRLWAYWNHATPPFLIEKCLSNWRTHCPDYELVVLNDENLQDYLPQLPVALGHTTVQQRSDWIRLALLQRYGGIWLDASTILTRSLDWILDQQQKEGDDFVGFYLERYTQSAHYPVVESWFMAAPAQSPFIAAVLEEFTREVIEKSGQEYIELLQKTGEYDAVVQNIDLPLYLCLHLAMQRVLQRPASRFRLSLFQAEATAFWLHHLAGWTRTGLKLRLFWMVPQANVAPLIKLRAPDRRKLEHYLQANLYLPNSIAAQYLMRNNKV